ncbi:CHAT domain-containing protein [Acrocarpospora pleiomorpha]|uniref:CHAT domain-containing protein n=1 Tax=Acrocarpospora pleiomorpha TaxID=90975 RepID=A0A5M3XR75_9ACTN|nr:CHAT domain-containing protein [Acrocarpospora pleiomorpha]GES23825.1 CHAT domain-containing protein [Acrocarpospora pleiomorpha]
MGEREKLLTVLRRRLERAREGETAELMAAEALADERRLAELVEERDLVGWTRLGQLSWFRYLAERRDSDLRAAVDYCARGYVNGVRDEDLPEPLLPLLANRAVATAEDLLQESTEVHDPDLLDDAVELWERIALHTPGDHENYAGRQDNFALSLLLRYRRTGSRDDLERAAVLQRSVVASTPPGHQNLARYMNNFAETLADRAQEYGLAEDLNAALGFYREAIRLTRPDDPGMRVYASNLARALASQTDPPDDAIEEIRGSVSGAEGAERADRLSDLAEALLGRAERTGAQADLDEAVEARRASVNLTALDDPERPNRLHLLAGTLQARFLRTNELVDLAMALRASELAVATCAPGHPYRAELLNGLGAVLMLRYPRLREARCLDAAIDAFQTAAAIGRNHGIFHGNYANALRQRFKLTGRAEDLDAAIAAAETALAEGGMAGAVRPVLRDNLALMLLERFQEARAAADLDAAIAHAETTVTETAGRPDQADALRTLGTGLELRYRATEDPADRDKSFTALEEAIRIESASPSTRVQIAMLASGLAAPDDPARAAELLDSAVRLLPETMPRRLDHADRLAHTRRVTGVAADAAALALAGGGPDAAARALGLLELGRSVLLGQLLETRTDLSDLAARRPDLAEEFIRLRDQLERPEDHVAEAFRSGIATVSDPSAERREAGEAFTRVLAEIRALPGHEAFGRPLAVPDLVAQAEAGPVITLNTSNHRCDALLLATDSVRHVPLRKLNLDLLADRTARFTQGLRDSLDPKSRLADRKAGGERMLDCLEWLWDVVAAPILDALGFTACPGVGEVWPRVWWASGGLLGRLPVHAAGYHRATNGQAVIDRVISSYTPTIRALGYARQAPSAKKRARPLVVVMPTTPGVPGALIHVEDEAAMIAARFPETVLLTASGSAGLRPTRENVLRHLPDCRVFHFAGHGFSDLDDPTRSTLLLADHATAPLTVASLGGVRLGRAQLAYLSACRTAITEDSHLADEAIHLATAFQLAGFPHVVGTLWEINDSVARTIAESFYARLGGSARERFAPERAAEALHHAVRAARDRYRQVPSLWAAHVYTGR